MRRDQITPGLRVVTTTASGQPIECTVLRREDEAQYLLKSTEHGYAIVRDYREIQPIAKQAEVNR